VANHQVAYLETILVKCVLYLKGMAGKSYSTVLLSR